MSSIIFFKTGIRARSKEKKKVLRKFICLFVILVFLLNFLYTNNNNYQSNYFINKGNSLKEEKLDKNLNSPELSQSPEALIKDPFTKNFNGTWTFFKNYFESKLNYDIPLYVSESNNTGTIIDNITFAEDNLLFYKSLAKEVENFDAGNTLEAYLKLKFTPLWYEGNASLFKYGFVKSLNGTNGDVIDGQRYLIDNLMPIFLLLENIGDKIDDPIEGTYPKNLVIEMFNLINSSEFFNSSDAGFLETNKTSSGNIYYTKSNLYAILAFYLIHQFNDAIDNITVTDRSYYLANNTMSTLVDKMWDNNELGFYSSAGSNWNTLLIPENRYKYLDVNALGIIALLESWLMTGMQNFDFINKSIALYNKLSEPSSRLGVGGLWNVTNKAYEYNRLDDWDWDSDADSMRIDLEANALMMQACLRLFEVSGNITYYNRALQIYDFLEKNLYDNSLNAYKTSFGGSGNNTNFNFLSNLRLSEAYLKAFEIYNSTVLEASYNISGKIDYIMNQDTLNLTSVYAFEKDLTFYNPETYQFGVKAIRFNNISGANITYIFRYPNDTIIEIKNQFFKENYTILEYKINNTLPFGDGYTIYIYANWTYFGLASTSKMFNVISGLKYNQTLGLKEWLYQGEKTNITLLIISNYNYSLTLNITMFGDGILTVTRENIIFINNTQTSIAFNITINNDATPGKKNITFTFINGSVLYLKKKIEIEIRNALSYSNLIYSKKVVPGNSVQIFLDLINALPNETQSLNLIFSGTYIHDINKSIILDENERRTVLYLVYTTSVVLISSIEIEMSISKGKTTFYTETLTVEIVPRLEVISIEFPEKITQGTYAYFIIIVQNNQESTEEFSLLINGDKVDTEINELIPGENRIEQEVLPSWNPYEFGAKTYKIEIEDSSEEVVFKDYFEYEIELSAINLIFFYMIPIIIPLGIILYYKNKEIKHKLLRR